MRAIFAPVITVGAHFWRVTDHLPDWVPPAQPQFRAPGLAPREVPCVVDAILSATANAVDLKVIGAPS